MSCYRVSFLYVEFIVSVVLVDVCLHGHGRVFLYVSRYKKGTSSVRLCVRVGF